MKTNNSFEQNPPAEENFIQLVRHATLLIKIGPYKLLVDPMLSPRGALDPVANAGNDIRIPITDLPFDAAWLDTMLQSVDAVIVTHLHRDHWDGAAKQKIDKYKWIFCQPADVNTIKSQGFQNVISFDNLTWKDLRFHRTGGQHGVGETGKKMGPVSGVIIEYKDKSVYIAGDTIWCDEVRDAINNYHPDYIVVNAGAAAFLTGGPITMTKEDVLTTLQYASDAQVIAVHMDTVNHCLLTRNLLKDYMKTIPLENTIVIPDDGQRITI